MQILVFGMHRSGTSMAARLLNMMGCYFAPEGASTGANEENPKGFWERRDVRALNDQVLYSTKSDWHRLGHFSLKAIPELTLGLFRKEAAKIILSMDGHRPWFLKEPRLCVLAPLWLELLEFPVCVFVHRSPMEVAASLKIRNGFPIRFSLALWEFYISSALNATLGLPRVQINQRDLIQNPIRTVRLLKENLEGNAGVRGLRLPSDEEVLAFVDSSLLRATTKDGDEAALTHAQRKLYQSFEAGSALSVTEPTCCSRGAIRAMRARDRAVDPENIIGRLGTENARLTAKIFASQGALTDMQSKLDDAHSTLAEKRVALSTSAAKLEALHWSLAEKRAALSASQKKLDDLHSSLAEKRAALLEADRVRAELKTVLEKTRQNLEKREVEMARQLDATNAKIGELRAAIARRDRHSKEITRLLEEKSYDVAAENEQVKKLRQLLKKAAREIDRIHQSSRWKAGSLVLLRPHKNRGDQALKKYVNTFEAWLEGRRELRLKERADMATEGWPRAKKALESSDLLFRKFDAESIDRITRQLHLPVSIVIPVYNGASDLERCTESVLRFTTIPFELILVDDCSPDRATRDLLKKYETHSAIQVLWQSENGGFVRSANAGIGAASGDVVLLNSDTEVSPRWLQKLIVAAYADPQVATVTPFSNAAGAFSVPKVGVNAPIPFPFTPLKMSRLIERLSSIAYPEVPTGNGFCMYIKRQVLDEIGKFDEGSFGRGYGEENDFCMRARKAGWRNVIDDSLFIYHRGNTSFGDEKPVLLKRNRETIDRLHPDYTTLVREFTNSKKINALRTRVGDALENGVAEWQLEKRRILYVLHEGTGGVPMTNADLVSQMSAVYQCFLLTSTGAEMILREWREGRLVERQRWKLKDAWSAKRFRQPAMREIYFQVLVGLGIDLVHIRHLFKHSFDAPSLCRALGIPVVLSFHDYYFLCPSIHLLDQNEKFCGGECTPGLEQCTIPSQMLQDLPMLKGFLPQWREHVAHVFDCCDAFVTTAESVQRAHVMAYPTLGQKPFWIIEHGRDLRRISNVAAPPLPDRSIRILVAGNIDHHKGSGFIRQVKELDSEDLIEFHFLGKTDETLRDIGVHHGSYRRENFENIVRQIRPSFAAVWSIWGETYSHTLTEAWAVGLPVLGSRLGAVGERITKHGGGWIVDTTDPSGTLAQIRAIARESGVYDNALREVEKIEFQNVEGMTQAYRGLYEEILAQGSRRGIPRVGYIVPVGNRGSTFLRVILPLAHEEMRARLFATPLPGTEVRNALNEWIDRLGLQTLLLQREALDNEAADVVIRACRERKVRIVLEIDDNLLDLTESHTDYAFYKSRIAAVRYLAENVDQIVVSTSKLVEVFQPLNPNICIIANALDEWLWFAPVRRDRSQPRTPGNIVAGYMGTKTHGADLQMIREPFLRAQRRLQANHDIRLDLEIVGGLEDESDEPQWYRRREVPSDRTLYPRFVRWLRETLVWDFALAPLCDESLNHSKSALKFFEYAGLGIAGIYSRVGEYSEVIENRETGLLLDPDASDEWENALVEMAASPDLRQKLATRARQQVKERHLLRGKIPSWFSALQPR